MTDPPSLDPFDEQSWAEHVAAMQTRSALVDQLRPATEELGAVLIGCHVAAAAAFRKRGAGSVPALGFDPASIRYHPTAPQSADSRASACRKLNRGNTLVRQVLGTLVAITLDDLYALGVLMVAGAPLRPTLAMARVLLDAAIQLGYLAAEDIDPTERSARAANRRIAAIDEERRDRDEEKLYADGLLAERTKLIDAGVADGLTTIKASGGPVFDPWPTARRMALSVGSEGTYDLFRVLSSAAHGQERSVLGLVTGSLVGGTEREMRARAAYFTGPTTAVAQGTLYLAGAYIGAHTDELVKTIHEAQRIWRLGSWGYPEIDDEIRRWQAGPEAE